MSKIPAPILPQPGALGASQPTNVVQKAVAPEKAPTPQLFGLGTMSQNQPVPAAQPVQPSQVAQNALMYRYLFGNQ